MSVSPGRHAELEGSKGRKGRGIVLNPIERIDRRLEVGGVRVVINRRPSAIDTERKNTRRTNAMVRALFLVRSSLEEWATVPYQKLV